MGVEWNWLVIVFHVELCYLAVLNLPVLLPEERYDI
jgi:hypothetical protein